MTRIKYLSIIVIGLSLCFSCKISSDRMRTAIRNVEDNPQQLEELLDKLGDVNKTIQYGYTPLMVAVKEESLSAMEIMLERGADPFKTDDYGDAFYYAMFSPSSEPLKLLIERFPELLDDEDFTASEIIFLLDTGREEKLEVLLDAGLPVDGMIRSSKTYLQYVCQYRNNYPETGILLLERGADPNLRDTQGFTPLLRATNGDLIEALVAAGGEVNATGPKGHTALFYNSVSKRTWNVKTLLENGAYLEPGLVVVETYESSWTDTEWDWVENTGNPRSILVGDLSYDKVTTTTTSSHSYAVPLLEYAEKHDEELAEMLKARNYPVE